MNTISTELTNDMAIVVVGFDGYCDIWNSYCHLLNQYWPDRPYPVFFLNNQKYFEYENINFKPCGLDAEWSQKTRKGVESLSNPYICLLLEDFFTAAKVDNQQIADALKLIKEDNIKYYKLGSFSKIKTKHYKNLDYLYTIPQNLEYGISLQPAIWERNFLLELIGPENYNAWIFEYDRIKETKGKTANSLEGCVYDNRNILQIKHGIVQGKFLPTVISYFKKKNYSFNLDSRPVMKKREFILYMIKSKGKFLIPPKNRMFTKKILNKMNMRFVSDKIENI